MIGFIIAECILFAVFVLYLVLYYFLGDGKNRWKDVGALITILVLLIINTILLFNKL